MSNAEKLAKFYEKITMEWRFAGTVADAKKYVEDRMFGPSMDEWLQKIAEFHGVDKDEAQRRFDMVMKAYGILE